MRTEPDKGPKLTTEFDRKVLNQLRRSYTSMSRITDHSAVVIIAINEDDGEVVIQVKTAGCLHGIGEHIADEAEGFITDLFPTKQKYDA